MSHSPAQVLAAAACHVPIALVSTDDLGAIRALAADLPAAFNWLGFECRLARGDRRVDFGVCIDSRDRGRDTVATALAAGEELPGLESLRPLLREWVDPSAQLHGLCPVLWAEWDRPAPGAVPFAFVCVDPGFPSDRPRPQIAAARLRVAAERCLELLRDRPPDLAALDKLDACARMLPADAHILHLAPMPPGRGRGLRVHTSLRLPDVLPWLRGIEWPGDLDAARRALELCYGAARVGVQVTLSDRPHPYLGIEYYTRSDPRSNLEWSRVLAGLVTAGLCDATKAEAVLGWFGDETVDLPGAAWFVNIQRQFYVKLVVAQGAFEAKVYLTLHPRFVPL